MKNLNSLTRYSLLGFLWAIIFFLPVQQEAFGQTTGISVSADGPLKYGSNTTLTLTLSPASTTTSTFTVTCTTCPSGGVPTFGGASVTNSNTLTVEPNVASITFTYSNTIVGTSSHVLTISGSASGTSFTNVFNVTVTPGDPYSFGLSTALSTTTAGTATTFTLSLYDAEGNLTIAPTGGVTFTLSTSGAGTSTPTFSTGSPTVTVGNSTTTFTYSNEKSGIYTITADVDGSTLTPTTATSSITVNPAAYSKIGITSSPSTPVAGSTVILTAKLKDQYDNDVTNESKTIIWSQSGPGIYSSNSSPTSSGSATTNFTTIGTISTTTLTAQDSNNTSISATLSLTSVAGPAASITVSPTTTAQTATVTTQLGLAAGTNTPTVTVKDANGNPVGSVTVTFSTSSGSVSNTTTTTDASGIASTTWTLGTTAGIQSLLVSTEGVTATTITATATADTDSKYVVTPATTSPVVGSQVLITAQLTDQYNNPVSTAGRIVSWTKSDVNGSFSTATSTTNASGVATVTFTAHSVVSTNTTITATDNNSTPRTGTTATNLITVAPGAASTLFVSTQPVGGASGAALATQPIIHIRDASGNLVNTATNTVTLTVSGGTISGTTSVAAVGGVATFSGLTFDGLVGTNYQFTFASSGLTSATSNNVTVTLGAASKLVVSTSPTAGTSGSALSPQPVVQVQDPGGNVVTSDNATQVTMTSSGGTLSGTTTVTASSGTATFTGVTLTGTPGATYTLTFTSTPTLTAATAAVTVPVGSATKLALTTAPVGGASDAPLTTQPVVSIQDSFNNVVNTATNTVTVSVSTGATLTGTTTVTPVNGVATFTNLGLTGASGVSYTLTFTSTPALTTVTSTVTLTAGSANNLIVITQPVAAANQAPLTIQPVVYIVDSSNNLVATATNTITVTATGGATVGGTTSVAAVNGVATFAGLTLSGTVGTNYQLVFASTGLTSATSTPTFLTGPGTASKLALTNTPIAGVSEAPFAPQPRIEIRDAQNNLVVNSTAQVSAQVTSGEGGIVTIQGVTNAVAGIAQFTDMALKGTPGVTYTISFTSGSLTAATMTATVAAPLNKPTVITGTATNVMSTSATLGGTVSDTGSSAITARGVCYSATTTSPTLSSQNTTCTTATGTSTGTFTVAVTGLSISTPYFVSAYATNAQGTAYGSTVTFTTTAMENPVPVVSSISPDAGSPGEEVTVTITGANFATGATIAAMTGITVSEVVRNSATSLTAKFTITSITTIGTRTVNIVNPSPGGGTSATGVSFRVTLPAPSPNNTSWPAGTLVQTSSTPKFEWGTVSNTVDYDIQVSNLSTFAQSVDCTFNCDGTDASNFVNTYSNITGNSFTLTSPLSVGLNYFWRIRANTSTVKGVWSDAIPFTVIAPPNAPGLVSPANNSLGLTGSVTLTWTPTANTTSYEFEVSKDLTFSLTAVYFSESTSSSTTSFVMPAFTSSSPVENFWRVRSVGPGGKGAWSDVYRYTRAALTSDPDGKSDIPTTYSLEQNYPNPFNPSTTIRFGLPETAPVTLEVYNLQGQKVTVLLQNVTKSAGMHTISFNASNLSTGVYVYRITVGSKFMSSQKMMLLK
jgi:hypothetical protein